MPIHLVNAVGVNVGPNYFLLRENLYVVIHFFLFLSFILILIIFLFIFLFVFVFIFIDLAIINFVIDK